MVCGLLAKHAAVAVLTLVFSGSRVGYRVCIADSPRGWFSLKFKYFTVQRDICHRHLEATKIFENGILENQVEPVFGVKV